MMPLALLSQGEKAEIVELCSRKHTCVGARRHQEQLDARIENIGLRIGKIIEMLNNEGNGPLLLKIDESRLALGRGMAMKIMVRRTEP